VNKSIKKFIAAFFIFACGPSFSQSYDYHQGYIFEQKYIKRMPIKKAEQIAASPGVFNQFLSWDWGAEKITHSRIKRVGDRLIIKFEKKPSLSLRDFSLESTKEVEGDSQLFKYLKSVPGYHIIGVIFGHDQPAFLLIPESGGALYFVETN
jgi:hypothetical protein